MRFDQSSGNLGIGHRIFSLVIAIIAFSLALLIFKFPLDHWYEAHGGLRARLIIYALELFWGPIGIVISSGFGALMLLVTFGKNTEPKADTKKPQPAQSLEKRSMPRNTITALMPARAIQLSTADLQRTLEKLLPDSASSAEVIELPDGTAHKRLARARFGDHVVRLAGLDQLISQAVQLETIDHSSFPAALTAPLHDHRAQIGLQYERGSDDPAVQMEVLHILACALLNNGLLGVVDQQACNAVPSAYFEQLLREGRAALEYTTGLPSEICTGTVQFVQPDAAVWFASRGFERFGAPNFAVKGDADDAPRAHEFFNKLLNYVHLHRASVEAGHTTELGGQLVRFYEPSVSEGFLRHGQHTTLVIAVENKAEIPLEPPTRSSNASKLDPRSLPVPTPLTVPRASGEEVTITLLLTRVSSAHVKLTNAESQWKDAHIYLAINLMHSLTETPSASKTTNLDDVYDLVRAIDVLRTRGFSHEQLKRAALQFGLYFGEMIASEQKLTWARPTDNSFVIHNKRTALDTVAFVQDIVANPVLPAHSLIPVFFFAADLKHVDMPETSLKTTVSKGEDVPGFQLGMKD